MDFAAANQAWAEKLGLKYPVLSDTRREMARAYGILNDDPSLAKSPKTIAGYLRNKATIMVVDKDGVIRLIRPTTKRGVVPLEEALELAEKLR